MTESFQVASLKAIQLTFHQGGFIEKPDLGGAFLKGPLSHPNRSCVGATGKENDTRESLHFSPSLSSRALNSCPALAVSLLNCGSLRLSITTDDGGHILYL